jgi:hypothetical protein
MAAVHRWRRHDRLRVYMAQDALALCHIRGRFRQAVVEKVVIDIPAAEHKTATVHEAIAALTAWVHSRSYAGSVEWIVGIEHVRYAMLPWDEQLLSDTFCKAFAEAMFAQQTGANATELATAEIRFAPLAYGCPRLAALIPGDIVRALTSFADNKRFRTTEITPALATVWDHFVDKFRKTEGTLVIVEGSRLQRMTYERGNIVEVTVRPFIATSGRSHPEVADYCFPDAQDGALAGEPLRPDHMPHLDDPRMAFALCGVR